MINENLSYFYLHTMMADEQRITYVVTMGPGMPDGDTRLLQKRWL